MAYPNFMEKTFVGGSKITKFMKIFSLESFPLYGMTLEPETSYYLGTFLESVSLVPSISGISIGGPKQSQVNLKKLNWRKMMLNQQSVTRAGGAIWKELPSVNLPKDTFTHLFTQHTIVKEKTAEKPVSGMLGKFYFCRWSC